MAQDMQAQHDRVIAREDRKFEKAKAKAEAYKENMTETLAGLLRQENNRKALARDAMAATKDESRLKAIHKKAGEGIYDDSQEVITGNEARLWESD